MRRISFSHQQPAGRGLSRQSVWQPALLPDRLPEYVSRYGSPTSPEALHQHRTLVYGGSQGANRWLFRQREEAWVHYPLTPLMTSNNADALLTSAIGGMGIVLFPDWMVSGRCTTGH